MSFLACWSPYIRPTRASTSIKILQGTLGPPNKPRGSRVQSRAKPNGLKSRQVVYKYLPSNRYKFWHLDYYHIYTCQIISLLSLTRILTWSTRLLTLPSDADSSTTPQEHSFCLASAGTLRQISKPKVTDLYQSLSSTTKHSLFLLSAIEVANSVPKQEKRARWFLLLKHGFLPHMPDLTQ